MMVFDRIYRTNGWNGTESRSGPGSGSVATRHVASAIAVLAEELRVESVLDLGCGDGYWMPKLPGYLGVDVSAEAIRHARRNHPDRRYQTTPPLGHFDLVISRDAMQHLALVEADRLLDFALTAGDWLLASTYINGANVDIETGHFYSPDLTAAPFNLPQPSQLIFDGYSYHDPDLIRDPGKHLGLWDLR
ncbi:MAG TPA: class I SAM-dependent methyltransferase [Actinomycetota bacterium]